MPTYYEMLKVSPSSPTAEIEVAIDAQYNQWRQLVTNHNPLVAEEANRNLRILETIRATLTDPAKRTVYDASLTVGGLADPSALLAAQGTISPPSQRAAPSATSASDRQIDTWVCPACGTASARGTRHCNRCATQLGIDCPKCGKLTLKNAPFCAECGADLQAEIERQTMERRAQEAAAVKQRLAALQTQVQAEQQEIGKLERQRSSLLPWLSATPFTNRHLGCLGHLIVVTATFAMALLPLALLGSSLLREPGALIVLTIGAAMVGAFLGAMIKRKFSQEAILKELETRHLRTAELEAEIRALSSSTVQ